MKASVILLTYNHEKYLQQALESVLNQETTFDFDITIIEDFSTDKTREIVIDYAKQYPDKIQLRLSSYNRCDNVLWFNSIETARGEYIALLDGDDFWTSPHKLQKQVEYLDSHPECSLCFHSSTYFYEDEMKAPFLSRPPGARAYYQLEELFLYDFIPTCSVLFRSGLFEKFPDWCSDLWAGDLPVLMLNAQYGSMGYMDEAMGATRIHSRGAWNGSSRKDQFKNLKNDYDLLSANLWEKDQKLIRNNISTCYFNFAVEAAQEGNTRAARLPVIHSFLQSPFHPEVKNLDRIKFLIKVVVPGMNRLVNALQKKQRPETE